MLSKIIWITVFVAMCFRSSEGEWTITECNNDAQVIAAASKNVQGIIPILVTDQPKNQEHRRWLGYFHAIHDVQKGIVVGMSQHASCTETYNYLKTGTSTISYPTLFVTLDGRLIDGQVTRSDPELFDQLYNSAEQSDPPYRYTGTLAEGVHVRIAQQKATIRENILATINMFNPGGMDSVATNNRSRYQGGIGMNDNPVQRQEAGQKRFLDLDRNKTPPAGTSVTPASGNYVPLITDDSNKRLATTSATTNNYQGVRPNNWSTPSGALQRSPVINRSTTFASPEGSSGSARRGSPNQGSQKRTPSQGKPPLPPT